jgi:hypothetical protein
MSGSAADSEGQRVRRGVARVCALGQTAHKGYDHIEGGRRDCRLGDEIGPEANKQEGSVTRPRRERVKVSVPMAGHWLAKTVIAPRRPGYLQALPRVRDCALSRQRSRKALIEIDKRTLDDNAFVKRVMAQPKLWVIGEGHGLAA